MKFFWVETLVALLCVSGTATITQAQSSDPAAASASKLDEFTKLLEHPDVGSWLWASEYKSECLTATEAQAGRELLQMVVKGPDAVERFTKIVADAMSKDNVAFETFVVGDQDDSRYYFTKDYNFGARSHLLNSMTESMTGNGTRLFVRQRGGEGVDNLYIDHQPPAAIEHMWLFGVARGAAAAASIVHRKGKRIGDRTWCLEKPTPYDVRGVLRPLWPIPMASMVATVSLGNASSSTLDIVLFGVHGQALTEYQVKARGGVLVDVCCRIPWVGTPSKTFAEMRAAVLAHDAGRQVPNAGDIIAESQPDPDAYILDHTEGNLRHSLRATDLPADFYWMRTEAQVDPYRAVTPVPVNAENTGMTAVDVWPPSAIVTPPAENAHVYFYVRNVGARPLRVKEAGASCGCLSVECAAATLVPFESLRIDVAIDAAALKPAGAREVVHVLLDDNGAERMVDWNVTWDRAAAPLGSAPRN